MARFDFIAVYLLANRKYGALYCGVTSDLPTRLDQHKRGAGSVFTAKYGHTKLVWYEQHETMPPALHREKRIKSWKRQWKINMIEEHNSDWDDLSSTLPVR
ncbi:MAG: GIY-YIG nuclease family protein [Henriciella sp.]|nr:GIY-YIG nuclease family protein [Henriciella sp.]